ncbi:MAG: Ig-like domain-containing protein, partial [Verrucomicrobiota bacterium]
NDPGNTYSFVSAMGFFNLYNFDYLSFWVWNNGSPLKFRIRLEDKNGNPWESNWAGIEPAMATTSANWENLVVDLTRAFSAHKAGSIDLRAITQIMFIAAPGDGSASGEFWLDDMEVQRAPNSAPLEAFESDFYGWSAGTNFVLTNTTEQFYNSGAATGLGQRSLRIKWGRKGVNYDNFIYTPSHDTNNSPRDRIGFYPNFKLSNNKTLELWVRSYTESNMPVLLKFNSTDVGTKNYTTRGSWQKLSWIYTNVAASTNVQTVWFMPYPGQSDTGGTIYIDGLNLVGGTAPVIPTAPTGFWTTATAPDGDGVYTMLWSAVSGVSGYQLQESTNASFATYTVSNLTGRAIRFTKTVTPAGVTYYYRVCSRIISGGVTNQGSCTAPVAATVKQIPNAARQYEVLDNYDGKTLAATYWQSDPAAPYVYTLDFTSTQAVHSGTKALKVTYNKAHETNNGYSCFSMAGFLNLRNYDYLSFWVYNNGSPLKFRLHLEDSAGRPWESCWANIEPRMMTAAADWENLVVDLTRTFAAHNATNIDMQQITQVMFMVEPGNVKTSGVFWLDDIELHRAGNSAPLEVFESDYYGWASGGPFVIGSVSNQFRNDGSLTGLGQQSLKVSWTNKTADYSNVAYVPSHDPAAPAGRIGAYPNLLLGGNGFVELWVKSTTDNNLPILLKLDANDVSVQTYTGNGQWQRLTWDYSALGGAGAVNNMVFYPYPGKADTGGTVYFDDLNLIGGSGPVLPVAPAGLAASAPVQRCFTVSWNAVSNATNYELVEADNLNFTGSAAYYPSGTSVGLGPRRSGTYYYRVRSNVPANGSDNYGSFSAPIAVTVVNHAPVVQGQSVAVAKNTAKPITLSGTDADGDALTYRVATAPAHGSVVGTPPQVAYQPDLNYSGADSFTFVANDGEMNSAAATVALSVSDTNDMVRILGTHNHSDAEFAQGNYILDFFLATDPVSKFPKELNTSWLPAVYVHADLNQVQVDRGLTVSLVPAWNNGSGVLYVGIEVWTGSRWVEAGRTPCSMNDAGYVYVHPSYLRVGMNDLRLMAYSGTAGTTAVNWDQLVFGLQAQDVRWAFGVNDYGSAEFQQGNFNLWVNADTATSADFPKEINSSWYPDQYLSFTLDQAGCQRPYQLNFDVSWNDGSGALSVALQRWDGSTWKQIGWAELSSALPGTIEIPADELKEGVNDWRLHVLGGSGGTTVVVWDRLALMKRVDQPVVVKDMLLTVLDTSLNFYLSTNAVHHDGFPLTALKVTDRPRYGYSNPTEWGLAIQAWIAAAEIGKIAKTSAAARIETSLNTMLALQADPSQFKYGLFYPYYTVVGADGRDVPFPYHDAYHELPSGDCALLWGSVNVAEGWLRQNGFTQIVAKAVSMKDAMDFRSCYRVLGGTNYGIAMLINADTGNLSASTWNNWADEGGLVNAVSYTAGSTTLDEFDLILSCQNRPPRTWSGVTTRESAWFSAAFTWPQRTMLGFPMFGDARERIYGIYSFIPAGRGHFLYADYAGIDYAGFSDAMTQTWLGQALVARYAPPNIPNIVEPTPPAHIQPHGLFVWFGALDVLEDSFVERAFELAVLLKNDSKGYWHASYSQDPYGFEVVASPYMNDAGYNGADDGRFIFETLSQSYTVLPIYEGLQRMSGNRTFQSFASQVPGCTNTTDLLIQRAYPNP